MKTEALIQTITPMQIADMIGDFNRLFAGGPCGPDSGSLSQTLSDAEKYRIVAWAVSDARLAAQEGELEYCHFLHGMAAAFHGLIRLIEARGMDKDLGSRLGMSTPTKKKRKSAGTPARKELPMAEVQTQFTFEDLVGFFAADELGFMADDEKGVVVSGFRTSRGPVRLLARFDEKQSVMLLLFAMPMTVPEGRRGEMAEAITRVNYGLVIGHFEMDMSDGDLNYRVTVPIKDAMLSHSQFRQCLGVAARAVELSAEAFFGIIHEGLTAKEAIKKVR